MQNTQSQTYKCPKCGALPGTPCVTIDGREAMKVHYGRPNRPEDPRMAAAFERAEIALSTSPLRPSVSKPGVWIGSEYVGRDVDVPYGAWYCSCGEERVTLSRAGVDEINRLYGEHADCREKS